MEKEIEDRNEKELKTFRINLESRSSKLKIDYYNSGVMYAFKVVTHLNVLWDEKKIKNMNDSEPRGISEEIQKDNPNVHTIVKVYCHNDVGFNYPMTEEEYKWYRFFRKLRMGI